jgi:two-component system sensor histidine kinase KdpD
VFDQRLRRVTVSLIGVALLTFTAHRLIPVNATTAGFAYLLLILFVASTWGFVEACLSSVLATLLFNFFFLPPIGTFTIADSQNWVALFSFLTTSLVASRLSAKAKLRALEAIEKQRNLEHLYSFSRAILLSTEPRLSQHNLCKKWWGSLALLQRHCMTGEAGNSIAQANPN